MRAGNRRGWVLVLGYCWVLSAGVEAGDAGPGPEELGRQLRAAAAKVRDAVVALSVAGGTASGVVVSENGWVLTAGHVVAGVKEGKRATLHFDDGRTAEATVAGWDLSSDFGMLKIVEGDSLGWPAVAVAKRSPDPGGFCFTLAHPSGRLDGRPAQLRIGRVRAKLGGEEANILIADCEIQPGDSGGPLFDLDGRLVGIDSSAGGEPGYNQFAMIERYQAAKRRLKKGRRWGDRSEGPAREGEMLLGLTENTIASLGEEMQRRLVSGHRPTMRFVKGAHDGNGGVEVTPQQLARLMTVESVALARGAIPHIGLDDPLLVRRLPAEAGHAVPPVELRLGGQVACMATAVGPRTLVSKLSEVGGGERLSARCGKRLVGLRLAASDPDWDLALLEAEEEGAWQAVAWPDDRVPVGAGDVLVALDGSGNLLWNVATDKTRPVPKKRSTGPLRDESLVSGFRAPYPLAIRHALSLYAADAGTPVYDLAGRFIGMHAARLSRTMGLIIPAEVLRERVERMGGGERSTSNAQHGTLN